MHRTGLFLIGMMVLGVVLGACDKDHDGSGGSSGISSCGAFSACGGDVVGTWHIQDFCTDNLEAAFDMVIDDPACSDIAQDITTEVSGTYTFDGTGTVSWARGQNIDFHLVWTPSCLTAANDGQPVDVPNTCANLDETYRTNPRYSDSSCVFDGTSCDCTIHALIESSGDDSYEVRDNQLLQAGDSPADYCISGDTLTIVEHDDETDVMVTLTREL
jgi:hypothetical protein